jgi:imidazolonepropionase-like amidohydrolase
MGRLRAQESRCRPEQRRQRQKKIKKETQPRQSKDKKPEPTPPKRDLKLEALLPYLEGKKTIVLAAESPSDLQTAVSLANEFKLKFVLNHISHSQPVLDYVASLKVPVIVGPIYEAPKEDERYDAVYSLPAQLYKRGVKIVFASYSAHNVRNLPDQAGFATAFGLPYDEALKAITINAAEIWGVADQLGSLDVGKTANVVAPFRTAIQRRTASKDHQTTPTMKIPSAWNPGSR